MGVGAAYAPFDALRRELRGLQAVRGTVPPWAFDVDANGSIDGRDRSVIAAHVGTERGFGIAPRAGYDFRADLFGRLEVSGLDLDAFGIEAMSGPAPPRPVVMCWHYGWYHPERRPQEPTTATYLGGDYLSDDAVVEEQFHRLKREFGIDADLLSWIDPTLGFEPTLDNFDAGYFGAPTASTRHFGWLYETAINLGSSLPMVLSDDSGRPQRLVANFRAMAHRMIDQDTGAVRGNVLRFGGRPVVFMFASHLLGTTLQSMLDVVRVMTEARRAFEEEAGVAPYLIGEETPFRAEQELGAGRTIRATLFDAVARYHHYEAEVVARFAADGPVRAGGDYLREILDVERRTIAALAGIRNRFTGAPVLVIPSSAAGFAKAGLPTLLAGRDDYVRLLRETRALAEEHLATINAASGVPPVHQAAPAIVGSWNEEFEGHALFPALRNQALVAGEQGGFEWLSAIKEVYGSAPLPHLDQSEEAAPLPLSHSAMRAPGTGMMARRSAPTDSRPTSQRVRSATRST